MIDDYKMLEEILDGSKIGVLGLLKGVSPYTVPVNFVYYAKHIYICVFGKNNLTIMSALNNMVRIIR